MRILWILLFFTSACSGQLLRAIVTSKPPVSSGTPVTLTQFTVGATPTSGSNVVLAFGSGNTSGHKITAVVMWACNATGSVCTAGASSLSSCSDTAGNTYTVKTSSKASIVGTNYSNMYVQVCTANTIAAGANTVTATFSGNTDATILNLYETTAGQDDQFGPATGTSATPTSASVTTTANGAFAIAAGLLDDGFGFGNGWFTVGSGWTLDYEKGGGNANGYAESQAQSTLGSLQGTVGSNFSGVTGPWVATIYTIKP